MTNNTNDDAQEIFDATPYLSLFIDKEGRWFQNGAEIIHPRIYRLFSGSLSRSEAGGYQVRVGNQVCAVEVEDAPYVVQCIETAESGQIVLILNDETREPFQPEDFWIGTENVPYVSIRGGQFHARFSRPAYYQLAEYVNSEDEESFYFTIGGQRIPVQFTPPDLSD